MEDREPDLRGLNPIGSDLRRLGFWYSFWYSLAPSELVSTWDCNELRMEARVGIEPTHKAFAEPCLTTWLPRRLLVRKLNQIRSLASLFGDTLRFAATRS